MYKKVANNILTVGQLKGFLTEFSNKDSISLTGVNGFSIAYDEEKGIVLLDEEKSIDEIVEQLNTPNECDGDVELDMSGQPYSVYEEAKEYLESWDCAITRDNIIKCVTEWKDNLLSQIGEDAHRRLQEMGIKDCTGLSWEEQDKSAKKHADQYDAYLKKISNPETPLNIR